MKNSTAAILIVEDDKYLINLIRINFQDYGYHVLTASDGLTTLELYQNENPDLIVLDIMLPKLDGFDVCKRIRSEDKQIPILMLTAKTEEVGKVLGLELGADDYITNI